jgi:Ca2+-binding EF-hand superfamily protein
MMNTCRLLGSSALVLTLLTMSSRADDTQKDLPGPIDSLQDLQDTGKMIFKMADDDNDGQISQQEAIDAGNLLVGGYFFRADANGDGAVSKEEMQQAREKILARKPFLRVLVTRAKGTQGNAPENRSNTNAAQGVLSVLDSNNDNQIQATEMKQMVQTTVQSLFASADTNRDGKMSPSEVNAAIAGAARSVVQAAFQNADKDGNGQLSQAEYDKAIVEPANAVFRMLDANNDSQISQQEFQAAQQFLASQFRRLNVPEPANSPRNLIESGRTPAQAAPVPNFNPNPANRPAQPAAPAPAPAQPRR